ncbi:hypothetical protein GGH92_002897 [Coemansia sp. RSA 2673]|nr:hypothetical protein GGH92_002897 [Coemansia sp. RSA 2673]
MDNLGPGASLWQIKLAQLRVKKKVEERQRELKELTKERVRLEQLESTAAALPALPAVGNNPASPTAPASFPVGALDALGAFNDFDDVGDISVFDECYALDTVANVADTTAATATADPPAVLLDGPDYSTLVAAAASLPTAPSVTPAAPDAASPPAATLTTLAFLALVALHATLAADSSAAAIVPRTAAKDANSPTETPDALPPPLPIVATTASKTNSAVRPADVTTVVSPAAAQDISMDMAPPAKRQRTSALQDSNGKLVTRAHLSKACGPFVFLKPQMVPVLLHRTPGCQFAFDDADLPEFVETLQVTKGFKPLIINVKPANSDMTTSLNLVQRDGPEFATIKRQLVDRLRLPRGYSAVVPGPLLFYYLATLSYVPIDELSGTAMAKMFTEATCRVVGSLRFATNRGTRQKTKDELFGQVRNWLDGMSHFVIKGGSVNKVLKMAAKCRAAYLEKCKLKDTPDPDMDADLHANLEADADADLDSDLDADLDSELDANLDLTGEIAVEMLRKGTHYSRILLGIRVKELEVFFRYLPGLMKGRDEAVVQQLTEIIDSHFNEP